MEHSLTQFKVDGGNELRCNECGYVVFISRDTKTIQVRSNGDTDVTHYGKIIQPNHEIHPDLFTNAYTTLN